MGRDQLQLGRGEVGGSLSSLSSITSLTSLTSLTNIPALTPLTLLTPLTPLTPGVQVFTPAPGEVPGLGEVVVLVLLRFACNQVQVI